MTVRYRYRAATPQGDLVEGTVEAPSRRQVLEQIHRQRLYPVTVEEFSATEEGRRGRKVVRLGRRASVTVWTRNVATLLAAGVPLDRALAFTTEHAGHQGLADVLRRVRRSVQGGSTLADALSSHPDYFSPVYAAMVAAGEASGTLDVVFERLSEHLEETDDLRSQVRTALLYPALMSMVAGLGVLVLLLFVIPRFNAILQDVGGTLPTTTRLLVGVSLVVTQWWWLLLLLAVAAAYGARRTLAQPELRRRWHAARLTWPVVGDLELKYATAAFTRTLGTLLRSGVPMLPALRIARSAVGNLEVREAIDRAATAVSQGSAVAPSLDGALPPMALQMITVGEESGKLEELCVRVANTYDGQVKRAVRAAVALIEPAMILVFGVLVGFVALAMLQAIYSINTTAF